jgi:uncharacterized RDD family membrane protein YckC
MICRNHVDVSEGIRRCGRCGATFCRDCLVEIGGTAYCATCKTEQLLDARSGVQQTVLDIAGIGRRFVGYFIDTILMSFMNVIIGWGIGFVMALAGAANAVSVVGALIGLLIGVAYDALLTAARGQTLGKMAMTMKVVSEDGSQVTTGQAWGRAFAKLIPFSALVALFNQERKGIHDMLARTRVVNWR